MTNYQSEKEILVFDTFYSDVLKIVEFKEQ